MEDQDQSIKNRRNHIRVDLKKPVRVKLASLGGLVCYDSETSNISYNGFFLAFAEPKRFPFTTSSILEVWIQIDDDNQIFFNGKLARIVFAEESGSLPITPGIAIRIIQIDSVNEKKLDQFITQMAPGLDKKSKTVA